MTTDEALLQAVTRHPLRWVVCEMVRRHPRETVRGRTRLQHEVFLVEWELQRTGAPPIPLYEYVRFHYMSMSDGIMAPTVWIWMRISHG